MEGSSLDVLRVVVDLSVCVVNVKALRAHLKQSIMAEFSIRCKKGGKMLCVDSTVSSDVHLCGAGIPNAEGKNF